MTYYPSNPGPTATPTWPTYVPIYPQPIYVPYPVYYSPPLNSPTREEFDELKREIERLKEVIKGQLERGV